MAAGEDTSYRRNVIYLDYHASTPCDPRVVEAMLPYFVERFGNPSSGMHAPGQLAAEAVDRARSSVARAVGSSPAELVFTSGATESNNLAILGLARASGGKRQRILASAIEHKSVLAPCEVLGRQGFEFVPIPVDNHGLVDLGALIELADDRTLLVSVQAANNEIGTIQPVAEIAQIAHRVGATMHCDAVQALGRVVVHVREWDVDLASFSAHKCYGPKGVGALYVRGGLRTAPLEPLLYGGGQQQAVRPGTLNVPAIVGFGKAAELVSAELATESSRLRRLRDWLEEMIRNGLPDLRRNGAIERRLPGNSSLLFPGVEAEAIIAHLTNIAVSTGSACTSGAPEPSHVLTAVGLCRADAYSTLRIGLGRFTMEGEVQAAVSKIVDAVNAIRSASAAVA